MNSFVKDSLSKIVRHAYTTVPTYQEFLHEKGMTIDDFDVSKFHHLPLIDKSIALNGNMLSSVFNNNLATKDIIIRRTSGSSGHYMKIYWNRHDDLRSMLQLFYRRKKYYNISTNDKNCYFYTTNYINNRFVAEDDESLSLDGNSLGFCKLNLTQERVGEIYERILAFNPIWLNFQPSLALIVADHIKANKLPAIKDLRYIELTGEYLTLDMRAELSNIFKCKIANQYGCIETNSIASDCGGNQLFVNTSNVYVEIIKNGQVLPDGEVGDIYITSLANYAMPFIRYRIGERGSLSPAKLTGNDSNQLVLNLLNGRTSTFIRTERAERLPLYIFYKPIEFINEKIGNIISQFQVEQIAIDQFNVNLVIKNEYIGWKNTVMEMFIAQLKNDDLRNAKWHFSFSERLFPDEKTGKLNFFVNRMKEI
ncbi:MAG: hypothetical protein FWG91_11680 [Lachnospiraceae bacterium]|nr:hypothetical protein [Lachnospiraceae bacterium]